MTTRNKTHTNWECCDKTHNVQRPQRPCGACQCVSMMPPRPRAQTRIHGTDCRCNRTDKLRAERNMQWRLALRIDIDSGAWRFRSGNWFVAIVWTAFCYLRETNSVTHSSHIVSPFANHVLGILPRFVFSLYLGRTFSKKQNSKYIIWDALREEQANIVNGCYSFIIDCIFAFRVCL